MTTDKTDLSPAARLEWVANLKRHPDIIGRMVGFKDLTPLHGKWIRQMVWGNEDYTLQAHRGSYKSSCLVAAIGIILDRALGKPEENIRIESSEADFEETQRRLEAIFAMVEDED